MKILLIDDNAQLVNHLALDLKKQNVNVSVFQGESTNLLLDQLMRYELIVLNTFVSRDVTHRFVTLLRESHFQGHLIVSVPPEHFSSIKAQTTPQTVLCLVGPATFIDLLAQIRTVLKLYKVINSRSQSNSNRPVLNASTNTVNFKNKDIVLTNYEFNLLQLFVERQEEIFSPEYIALSIWDIQFNFCVNLVDRAINRLQNKLGCDSNERLISTIRGVGYTYIEKMH